MGRLTCFFLVIYILADLTQAQSHAGGTATAELHNNISSSLPVRPVSQPRARVPLGSVAPLQVFQCNGKVTLETCKQEMLVLKTLLDKYGADQLGQWKWVLVSSQQWEATLAKKGFSPNVPAFTSLEARITFFDDALIAGSPGRLSQLIDVWQMSRSGLLDLAVRHELGHAFCRYITEPAAERVASVLDQKKAVTCKSVDHR